jgi:P-type E1-E2 ATPase
MRSVDVVLFDKTGTLTQGQHVVTRAVTVHGVTDTEHPVTRAIRPGGQRVRQAGP